MKLHAVFLVFAAGFLAACAATDAPASERSAKALQFLDGNPSCADLGFAEELKIDQSELVQGAWIVSSDGELEVQVFTVDGKHFAWISNLGIDAVIAKGGDGANVYSYDPEALQGAGLVTPDNSSGGPAAISHISFCYDWEVLVSKSASTSFHREFSWQIQKEALGDPALLLSAGQIYLMPYRVSVSSSYSDSDFAVSGVISVHNPSAEHSAILASVSDSLAGVGDLAVDCGQVVFPFVLGPGASLECSYSSTLPDGQDRLNTALVEVAPGSAVGGGSGTADVSFGEPDSVTDECVDVDDDQAGFLGSTCEDQVFEYILPIGPYSACTEHTFDNEALFTASDSGAQGSDSVSIPVEVACAPDGCSLTPGYWKTHSEFGPAPYDDTWAQLPDGASTIFYLSGQSYHQVLWTAPKGNAYFILAHAFIAAVLNGLNGADVSEVGDELAAAQTIFESHSPAQIGSLRPKADLRILILSLASTLDGYNNGLIGPGHCSE